MWNVWAVSCILNFGPALFGLHVRAHTFIPKHLADGKNKYRDIDVSYYRFLFSCQTSDKFLNVHLRVWGKLDDPLTGETFYMCKFGPVRSCFDVRCMHWFTLRYAFLVWCRVFSKLILMFLLIVCLSCRDTLMGHQPFRLQPGPGTQAVCLQALGPFLCRCQR